MAGSAGSAYRDRPAQWVQCGVVLWPLALASALVLPLLTGPGHPLGRDLVFVPHQPLTDASLGLGDGPPRAVPLDAVVAALTAVVDGGLLARVVLPLTLAVAGWGVARLVAPLGAVAQVGATTFAVWNAYVVERLALGQWALLLAYAALPWLVPVAARFRREGRRQDLGAALAWAAVASLTPTGGLLAVAGVAAATLGRSRRAAAAILGVLLLQAPWLVAALTAPSTRLSDIAGVAAFAPDTESRWGPAVALLGLGGVWDADAEPATRTTWLALVAASVVVGSVVGGWRSLRRCWSVGEDARWAWLAGSGAVVAIVVTTPLGAAALEWAVAYVPGAGLLRDTQKLMAPAAVLGAAAFGAVVSRTVERVTRLEPEVRVALLTPLLACPLVLLPDATTVTWPTVRPVRFPEGLERVSSALDDAGAGDDVLVTVPWRSYRAFSWAEHDLTSSDPATRWLDARVVTSDDLQVGSTLVAGESPLSARIGTALADGAPVRDLADLGVRWVVVYPDDPDAGTLDLSGLRQVYADPDVALYETGGDTSTSIVPTGRRIAVAVAHLTWLGLLVGGLLTARTASRGRDDPARKKARRASY